MKYNPKKVIARLLKNAKKIPKIRTAASKQKYLEGCAKKMDKNPTGPEEKFIELLKSIDVVFETQKIVHGKIFDFFIPHKNLIIEIDGDYWHGYGLKMENMNKMQQKSFKNDLRKESLAKTSGYNLIRIWEHELNKEQYEQTKIKVQDLLN